MKGINKIKLGIIGSGQLGKMLLYETIRWDVETFILSNEANAPSKLQCNHFELGDYMNFDQVLQFGRKVDVLTIEIEHINVDALEVLEKEGINVFPQPGALRIIQDKGIQKQFYHTHNIPTSAFQLFDSKELIEAAISKKSITYPFIQKLRKGGYDGRGVSIINSADDLGLLLDGPSVIEQKVNIAMEVAVIVARGIGGEIKTFDPVEMVFDNRANLIDLLLFPARLNKETTLKLEAIALDTVEKLNMVGLLAVEMFIDIDGNLLVNEVAPRPHNSGHQTIEACYTSQYQQHLRAILGLPLGSTAIRCSAAMINLLGDAGVSGPVVYKGMEDCLNKPGVYVHLYGKAQTKPYRKMGHITVCASTIEEAMQTAHWVKEKIKVTT